MLNCRCGTGCLLSESKRIPNSGDIAGRSMRASAETDIKRVASAGRPHVDGATPLTLARCGIASNGCFAAARPDWAMPAQGRLPADTNGR
jgi:hypothetical protein